MARGGCLERPCDGVAVGVLRQVAEGAGRESTCDGLVVGIRGEHDDLRSRMSVADGGRGGDAVETRHPQIHEDDVRVGGRRQLDGFLPVGGRSHDLDPGHEPEQGDEAVADDGLVVGDDDPHACSATVTPLVDARPVPFGSSTATRQPVPPAGPAVIEPPSSSRRSRMPVNP